MADKTGIEWTESTWNPVTGCTKVSSGCKHCYAERMSMRLKAMGVKKYAKGFELTLHPDVLGEPLKWKKSRIIFVCSMSDLFHEDVPFPFIWQVFEVMREADWHTFQVLTKRICRLSNSVKKLTFSPNIWVGASVESAKHMDRIDELRTVPAAVRFLSLEPLVGPLPNLNLDGINWVIVGGESGPGARPMDPDWARDIRHQCVVQDVPFFFKQWGGVNKKKAGRLMDGREWNEMPEVGLLAIKGARS